MDADLVLEGRYVRLEPLSLGHVAALVAAKIAVCEVAEAPHDLERVFLDLTRRPTKAAA